MKQLRRIACSVPLSRLAEGEVVLSGFTQRQLYKGRFVIPKNCSFIATILHPFHDSPIGGHSGEQKTYQRIAQDWFWEGMKKQITEYVKTCVVCQRQEASSLSPAGLLQPLLIPTQVWEHISMDFVEGLPKVKGKDTILVIVDRLTKYAHFVALKHHFISMIAETFIKEVVCLHGFPPQLSRTEISSS